MPEQLKSENLHKTLGLLARRLDLAQTDAVRLVVRGGSALIAEGLVQRTTQDVDIVALMDTENTLISPVPLPDFLLKAAREVARDMGLGENWLNNGPSADDGGLFQLGLPAGFAQRLKERIYGVRLSVHFASRFDQIHFKLYAAVDRGGVHVDDLITLRPSGDEIEAAAR